MTIIGRDVTSRLERNSASRVALPAMNWALTTPAQTMAVKTAALGCWRDSAIRATRLALPDQLVCERPRTISWVKGK
jgi:hypothetical protein